MKILKQNFISCLVVNVQHLLKIIWA